MGTTPSRAGRAVPLLWASLAITAGFLLFRLVGPPVPAIAALFACELGVANLCPLSLALTVAAAPANGDTANARTSYLPARSSSPPPYLLGSLADHLGPHAAFTIVPVLIRGCTVLLPAGLRLAQRPSSGSSP